MFLEDTQRLLRVRPLRRRQGQYAYPLVTDLFALTYFKEGYVCSCRSGYVDASPNATHYPGRVCRKPIEKLTVADFTSSFSHDSCDPKVCRLPSVYGELLSYLPCRDLHVVRTKCAPIGVNEDITRASVRTTRSGTRTARAEVGELL